MSNTSYSNKIPGLGSFIKRKLAQFPLAIEFLAAALAVADPSTPKWAKVMLVSAIAYVISPFDAIPDFIPVLGWMDDVGVLSAAVYGAAGASIREDHRQRAREILGGH